jgi:hypothetical protein
VWSVLSTDVLEGEKSEAEGSSETSRIYIIYISEESSPVLHSYLVRNSNLTYYMGRDSVCLFWNGGRRKCELRASLFWDIKQLMLVLGC